MQSYEKSNAEFSLPSAPVHAQYANKGLVFADSN